MNLNHIVLESELITRIQQVAGRKNSDVMELVNQAVREHLQRLEDEKFEAEAEAYEQMHPRLVEQYLGQYVAIHEGQVVGHDPDFETLFLAMNEKYEGIPIFFHKVTELPILELRGPSPRLEQSVMP
jgi:hypothetical protein